MSVTTILAIIRIDHLLLGGALSARGIQYSRVDATKSKRVFDNIQYIQAGGYIQNDVEVHAI